MRMNLGISAAFFAAYLMIFSLGCAAETSGECLDATCGAFISSKQVDMFSSVSQTPCTENDYSYAFGECNSETNKRPVVPFWRPPAVCNQSAISLPEVKYIPCDASCPEGEIYDLETGTCSQCPSGSVSSEATRLYNVWHGSLPAQMRSTCVQKSANKPCTPWTLHDTYIDSGDNLVANNIESTLEYSFTLQTSGSIEVRYRVSSELKYDTGSIIVDSDVMVRVSGDLDWNTTVIPLSAGPHVVQFVYTTDLASSAFDDRFYVEYIKVTGLAPVGLKCTKCDPGFSQPNSAQVSCRMCLPGTFSDVEGSTACAECPLGYHSFAGASSCFRSRQCSEEDMTYTLTACDPTTMTQTKSYSWISPAACIVGSKALPDDEVISCTVPTTCNPGMYLDGDKKCQFCHSDEMSATGGECEACPSGRTPTMKARYFNSWDSLPEGFSTVCQGQCSTNGWRPSHVFIDSGSSLGIGSSSLSYAFTTEKGAKVGFSVEPNCDPSMNFSFYDNGALKSSIACGGCSAGITEMSFDLDEGVHQLKWVVTSGTALLEASSCSSVRLYSVSVVGITGVTGGATSCSDCASGYIVTDSNECVPCVAGSYSEAGDTVCTPCPPGTISHAHSGYCFKCGNGTDPNDDQSSCEIACNSITTTWGKTFVNDVFNISFLGTDDIQFNPDDDEFTINLCGKSKCFGDSYDSFLCATITDPETMDTHFYSGDLLTFVNIPQYSRKALVARVDSTKDGVCVASLILLCDPSLNETADPVVQESVIDGCEFNIVIRSPDACRNCDEHDYSILLGPCFGGKMNQTTTVITDMCRGPSEVIEEVECEAHVTVLTSLIAIISVGCVLILLCIIAVIIILVVRNRRIYGKYQKLMVASETGEAFSTDSDDEDE